ncbi:hypothetical protein TRVL_09309 [Trypanosoma vivax]|nr:hypothetical protein TRVL_09309 [Trypanosoma vivax]
MPPNALTDRCSFVTRPTPVTACTVFLPLAQVVLATPQASESPADSLDKFAHHHPGNTSSTPVLRQRFVVLVRRDPVRARSVLTEPIQAHWPERNRRAPTLRRSPFPLRILLPTVLPSAPTIPVNALVSAPLLRPISRLPRFPAFFRSFPFQLRMCAGICAQASRSCGKNRVPAAFGIPDQSPTAHAKLRFHRRRARAASGPTGQRRGPSCATFALQFVRSPASVI